MADLAIHERDATEVVAIADAIERARREGYEAGHAAGVREGAESMRERIATEARRRWSGTAHWIAEVPLTPDTERDDG